MRLHKEDAMKNIKKMIAPVIITVLLLLYLGVYWYLIMEATEFQPFMIFLAIPVLLLGAGLVYVLLSRIREIRSGEEDDLDNY